ncbi:MAG: hypothetical protein NZ699_13530 [Roseiflexus sp.]|nr:hypothetical protein [Roseiflexus sp.]
MRALMRLSLPGVWQRRDKSGQALVARHSSRGSQKRRDESRANGCHSSLITRHSLARYRASSRRAGRLSVGVF